MESLSYCLRLLAAPACNSMSKSKFISASSLLPLSPVAIAAGKIWRHLGSGPTSPFGSYSSFTTTTSSPLNRWNCAPPNRQLGIRLFSSRVLPNPLWHASTFSSHGCRSLTLAYSFPEPLQPCSRPSPHSTLTSTRGHATCALAAEGLLGSLPTITTNTPNTTNISNAANMADRDLLPDTFKADHYDLKLTNLDFKDWSYNGSVTYEICSPSCP